MENRVSMKRYRVSLYGAGNGESETFFWAEEADMMKLVDMMNKGTYPTGISINIMEWEDGGEKHPRPGQ